MSNPPVISIIDDDGSVRAATCNLVRSLGYVVHTFASAGEFLRSPHLHDTSCVIADVQMPVMSGLELQAHLLADGYRMPFIFITAFSSRERARASTEGRSELLPDQALHRRGVDQLPRRRPARARRGNEQMTRSVADICTAIPIGPATEQNNNAIPPKSAGPRRSYLGISRSTI